MAETHFDEWVAQNISRLWPELFRPDVLGPTVEDLAELASAGRAAEFGTARLVGRPFSCC